MMRGSRHCWVDGNVENVNCVWTLEQARGIWLFQSWLLIDGSSVVESSVLFPTPWGTERGGLKSSLWQQHRYQLYQPLVYQ